MVKKQKNDKKKKQLLKLEKKEFLIKEKQKIVNLSDKLRKYVERNRDTKYINHKIFYLLHDPFTFVNAYAKISKIKVLWLKVMKMIKVWNYSDWKKFLEYQIS